MERGYSTIGLGEQLSIKYRLEVLKGYWHRYWPYLLFLLAVAEIMVVVMSFFSWISFCLERYNETVGIEKLMWSLLPTFGFLNGIFLSAYTAYRAQKIIRQDHNEKQTK